MIRRVLPWLFICGAALAQVSGGSLSGSSVFTAQIIAPVGSAGAPSYSFAGNTALGWYLNGTALTSPGNATVSGNLTSSGTLFINSNTRSGGGVFSISGGTGACATTSTLVGGKIAGHFTCTGTTGASTVTITFAATGNGYVCYGRDITTPTTVTQTGAPSTTAITLTLASVTANDVIQFACPISY